MFEYFRVRARHFVQCWKHAKNHWAVSMVIVLVVIYGAFMKLRPFIQLGNWADTSRFPKLPLPLALFIIALVLLFIVFEGSFLLHHASIIFFDNRGALQKERHGLSGELTSLGDSFWVMWQVGHQMTQITPEARRKIQRMILGNPQADHSVLEHWARTSDAGTVANIKARIEDATRLAREAGTLVRWNDEQSISIVIGNPRSTTNSGWIRVEYILPFLPTTSRPSLLVRQKDHASLFSTFIQTYEKMWVDSKEPTKLVH